MLPVLASIQVEDKVKSITACKYSIGVHHVCPKLNSIIEDRMEKVLKTLY